MNLKETYRWFFNFSKFYVYNKECKNWKHACDGNGAYLKTRTNKQYYCLLVKNGHVITKIVHSSNDGNFYLNQRNGCDYQAIQADINDVYLIERSYHRNKLIPLLRQMIVRIKAVKTGLHENYCCVVYTESQDEQIAEVESLLLHGNAKLFTQLYIRTSTHVLTGVDSLASQNINSNTLCLKDLVVFIIQKACLMNQEILSKSKTESNSWKVVQNTISKTNKLMMSLQHFLMLSKM